MSGKVFNTTAVGEYCFDLQTIEIDNDALGVSDERVREIIQRGDIYSLTGQELKVYQTYLHEFVHYLDSTTSQWGLEYCGRLYKFYEAGEDTQFDVLSINSSEVLFHHKGDLGSTHQGFDKVTVDLDYDSEQGIHSIVHYESAGEHLYSIPLSMLSILEGHAFAQEKLYTWKAYSHQNDVVSMCLLESEVQQLIKDPTSSEYTCLLSMVYQELPDLTFPQKLEIIIAVCSCALNLSTMRMCKVPHKIINSCFPNQEEDHLAALAMDFSRGMNRASYAFMLLVLLDSHNRTVGLNCDRPIYNQIDEILNEYIPDPLGSFDMQAEMNMKIDILRELNADLVVHTATQHQGLSRYEFDLQTLMLPDVMLSSLEYAPAANPLDYSIPDHEERYALAQSALKKKRKGLEYNKQHLKPRQYKQWLDAIKSGHGSGIIYLE